MRFKKGSIPWNKGVPMKQETKEKLSKARTGKPSLKKGRKYPHLSGKNHPMWKGGRRKTSQGYVHILQRNHPRANKQDYVPEQVLITEKALNRLLKPNETIHHINENRSDNHPKNLYLFESITAHKRYHMLLRYNKCKRIIESNLKK